MLNMQLKYQPLKRKCQSTWKFKETGRHLYNTHINVTPHVENKNQFYLLNPKTGAYTCISELGTSNSLNK